MAQTSREKQLCKLGLSFLPEPQAFHVELSEREFAILALTAIDNLADRSAARTPASENRICSGVLTTLRDSNSAAVIRVYNHGPDFVTIAYGDVPAVSGVFGAVLGTGDVDESPAPVRGKVTAICDTGKTAVVTFTSF